MTMSFFILINHDNSLNLEKINICFNLNLIGIIYDLFCILVSMINYQLFSKNLNEKIEGFIQKFSFYIFYCVFVIKLLLLIAIKVLKVKIKARENSLLSNSDTKSADIEKQLFKE